MPETTINEIRIAWERFGEPGGVPLILIHGLGMPLNAWPPDMIERLAADGFDIVALDNRDIGRSQLFDGFGVPNLAWQLVRQRLGLPARRAYSLDSMADDVAALMDHLGWAEAHVVGVSMGGMITQVLALRHPDRLSSLTSIMSTTGNPRLPGPRRDVLRGILRRPTTEDTDTRIAHSLSLMRMIRSPGFDVDFEHLEHRLRAMHARGVTRGGVVRQMLAIGTAGNRAPALKAVQVPSLIVHGRDDPLVPVECGIDTAKSIPGARLEVIDGMGHDLPPGVIERMTPMIAEHALSAAANA